MKQTVPYEQTGRTGQKARTRQALVEAARGLLAEGVTPTMDGVASAASISRTTAYRYFPNLRALLVEAYPHIEQESLLEPDAPDDPVARLELVADNQVRRVLEYEAEMRAVLRLSLEPGGAEGPDLPMNRGLRVGWIEDAVIGLRARLGKRDFTSLVQGIGAGLGIEAFVWLTDVAGLSPEQAAAVMRTNARAVLVGTLSQRRGERRR
jgi:AcrR family transcriptional regulator